MICAQSVINDISLTNDFYIKSFVDELYSFPFNQLVNACRTQWIMSDWSECKPIHGHKQCNTGIQQLHIICVQIDRKCLHSVNMKSLHLYSYHQHADKFYILYTYMYK